MNYLVDTNVYCEPLRAKPDPKVVSWLRAHESSIYLSAVTIGEIRRGIERLSDGTKKAKLHHWLQAVCEAMKGRILAFNVSTAHIWGQLKANMESTGRALPSLDGQIAATALRHGLDIVTRNTVDFQHTGVQVINPFED
ncbi:type II toxin-antitoxin system VapC family toxin [Verrucomicrobium spinosum]|uniref:type II toxin-antitoxin system VapC family toxin n=1 Tax=Verrucomicrobium spinosum TaxID=2736 RepID=UPI0001745546|nr:type II toxin-antitoxin system VapC family toxin [Verrucomicrobium spinosum]